MFNVNNIFKEYVFFDVNNIFSVYVFFDINYIFNGYVLLIVNYILMRAYVILLLMRQLVFFTLIRTHKS